jgi:uncharacterized protein (DUF1697 family)
MKELKAGLESAGLKEVITYINSGNIIFSTSDPETGLVSSVSTVVQEISGVVCDVVVLQANRFVKAINSAPGWWGQDPAWKHNALFVIPPVTPDQVVEAIGGLKPGIENVATGDGVVFQSMLFAKFGQTTTGKLASNPIYKKMTIRNFNTAQKLAALLKAD